MGGIITATLLDEVKAASLNSESDTTPSESEATIQEITTEETFEVSGESLWKRLKKLVHQGNIRRILIKNESGHLLLDIPMTAGILGGAASIALFPEIVAIGVIGSMFAHLTVTVEHRKIVPKNQQDVN